MAWLSNEGFICPIILSVNLLFFTEKGVQPSKFKEFFTEKSKMINHFEEKVP